MTSSLAAPLYIEKIGEKVLHWQTRVVCFGFFYSDVSAEWLTQIRTRRSLIEVESRSVAEIELDEGFVDAKGEEKEAESSTRVQRAE